MPLRIERNDICKVKADAIVLPANPWLERGRGSSADIYRAAGEAELSSACDKIGYVEYGHVVMTDGFKLPARYIMHAVVPYWEGNADAPQQLYSCYRECLERANKCGFESIAFPLLSSGNFKCPKDQALKIANSAIEEFFENYGYDLEVKIVLYDGESFDTAKYMYEDIDEYIDNNYVKGNEGAGDKKDACYSNAVSETALRYDVTGDREGRLGETTWREDAVLQSLSEIANQEKSDETDGRYGDAEHLDSADEEIPRRFFSFYTTKSKPAVSSSSANAPLDLDEVLVGVGENFHTVFERYVKDSGMKPAEIYGRANITKSLYSKIMCNVNYRPKKETIIAFAFAMKLSLEDTEYLLMKAGHALSDCSEFDIVCKYFLERKIFDIFTINETLYDRGLQILGSSVS